MEGSSEVSIHQRLTRMVSPTKWVGPFEKGQSSATRGDGEAVFFHHGAELVAEPVGGEDYGNGWYHYSMTFTPSASYPLGTTNFQFYASQASLGNSSRACFIWGVQLERSDYAGYYVPTVAASSYVGYPFYRYELPKQTATMNEAEIVSPENGTLYYQQDLTLIENKLNIVLRNEFHNMAQIKTIAIVNDRNGAKWMLGSDTGLEVTEGMAQTGVQQTDRTGYEITLTGLESYPFVIVFIFLSYL